MLPRAGEVGDRHNVLRAAGELDELGQDAAPGDVERDVNASGCERANLLEEGLAVGDGLGPEGAKALVVRRAGGSDHARATHRRELNGCAADASGRAGGRLDGGRERRSSGEVERRRDRRIVRQHRQLGLGRPLGTEAEHAIADGGVPDTRAELVDDARRLVAQLLGGSSSIRP